MTDSRIIMPGHLHGPEVRAVMRNCCAYVQHSDLEGISPVILESSYLRAPIICSTESNRFILNDRGVYFHQGKVGNLGKVLQEAVSGPVLLAKRGAAQLDKIVSTFSRDDVVGAYDDLLHRA